LYAFDQHVVDIHLHDAPNWALEDFVYALECNPRVLESEGHHLVIVDSPISDEGRLVFVWRVHLDLVISGIDVHEAKELWSWPAVAFTS